MRSVTPVMIRCTPPTVTTFHTANTWYENLEFDGNTIWLSNLTGNRIERPYDLDLWQTKAPEAQAVVGPLNPAAVGIDPLTYL